MSAPWAINLCVHPSSDDSTRFSATEIDSSTEKQLSTSPKLPLIAAGLPLDESWGWDEAAAREAALTLAEVSFPSPRVAFFHRGYAYGTPGVFGTRALDARTLAYWEVECPGGFYGTAMQFGIARRTHAVLHCPMAFENLIGGLPSAKQWDAYGLSHRGRLYHAGQAVGGGSDEASFPLRAPARVGMLFNGPAQRLDFYVDGAECGQGFREIDVDEGGEPYYPIISSTSQRTEFRLLGTRSSTTPFSLLSICVRAVRRMSPAGLKDHSFRGLALPPSVQGLLG